MLEVGIDSYVTLEEAGVLAAKTCLSSDPAYKKWLGLTDSDKEVLLRNSCRSINNLKFNGRRKKVSQVLEFPRVNTMPCGIGYRLFIGQFYDNGLYDGGSGDDGLDLVKEAQVCNAVYSALYNDLATNQIGVNIQGLTSKKAGPIAETYDKSKIGKGLSSEDAMAGIFTTKVYSLLTPWLAEARFNF